MNYRYFTFFLLVLLNLSSCVKDDGYYYTKEDILTGNDNKAWKVTRYELNNNNIHECFNDDVYTFFSDKNVNINNGSNICGNEPAEFTVTWSLNEEETELTIDGEVWEIVELTSDDLKLHLKEPSFHVNFEMKPN